MLVGWELRAQSNLVGAEIVRFPDYVIALYYLTLNKRLGYAVLPLTSGIITFLSGSIVVSLRGSFAKKVIPHTPSVRL